MKTRITYTRIDSVLYTEWFTIAPNLIIRASIDTERNSVRIYEFDSSDVYNFQGSSIASCKKYVRQELLNLGVNLNGEIRNGSILK